MDWTGLLDLATAVVRDTFGTPVLYFRDPTEFPELPPVSISAPFDPDFVALDPRGGAANVNSAVPVVDVRVADLGFKPSEDDEVVIAATRYRVMEARPSSSGMMKLHLRRVG